MAPSQVTDTAARREAAWCLVAQLTDQAAVQVVQVDKSPFQIGRKKDLSLTLPRPVVSGLHAELTIEGDNLFVRDLGSTNGTFLNGKRISQIEEIKDGDQLHFADFRMEVKHTPKKSPGQSIDGRIVSHSTAAEFEKLFREMSIVPHFQAIVSLKSGEVVGCEILARSEIEGMKTPEEMFSAASQFNLQAELSCNLRQVGVQKGSMLWQTPHLFINTHTEELSTFGLLDSLKSIRKVNSKVPITLEIREPLAKDTDLLIKFRRVLKDLNMTLAYDHFGSGQMRRSDLEKVRPEFVKFDMHLIREIHLAPAAQRSLLANMVDMVRSLGIVPVALGVESESEHNVCCEVGFELGQGFYYGRPTENVNTTMTINFSEIRAQ